MSEKLKIIRVFIGSPGGLDDERQAAHDVINSVNRSHSERWGLHFKLLGWENAVPGYVRPQSKINDDLDKCEYFIGVLWNRWGSRPSIDAEGYTSGFEEEYFRAKERIEKGLMKDMAIYFKSIEVPAGMEPGEEVRKVFDFKKKCIEEKKVFFKAFADVHAFRDVVREKLEEIGWHETEAFLNEAQQLNQTKKPSSSEENSAELSNSDTKLLSNEARSFLNELIQRPSDWETTLPYEIARLRLIGTAVTRSGNDDFYLGNHDANLIFKKFRNATLSQQEIRALIDCGVAGFQHQNVPLWRWLAKSEHSNGPWTRIEITSAIGNETEKKHAIELLSLGSQHIPAINDLFDKRRILTSWLSDEATSQIFDAAVSFLASCGRNEDLSLIEEIAAQCTPHRRMKVEGAIVGILSRTDVNTALNRVVEREVDKIDTKIINTLFASTSSILTPVILSCISAKPELIRLKATEILFHRNEITLDLAEILLTDSNYDIRLLAAESLRRFNNDFDEDVAKKALLFVKSASSLFSGTRRETDDTYYKRYRMNRLCELDYSTLKSKVISSNVFSDEELSALYLKYKSKEQSEIRKNLKNYFKLYFEEKLLKTKQNTTLNNEIEKNIRSLEVFIRTKHCNHALNALCNIQNSADIDIIRDVIDNYEIKSTEAVLCYLSKFGDWSDIDRVKKLGDYPSERISLLGIYRTELPKQKATTILALGRKRIADILSLDLDSSIRIEIAKQLPKKIFVELRDEILLRELNHEDSEYRIVFSLRCVELLPKSRVTRILDRYVDSADHRFYNSVHWLDLGASLSTRMARNIAGRVLFER